MRRLNQVIHQPMSGWEGATAEYCAFVDRRRGGRGGGRAESVSSVIRRRRTGDGAPYSASCSVQQRTDAVRYPTEGVSRTPPPTVVARCRFQRSREAGGQLWHSLPHPLRCMP